MTDHALSQPDLSAAVADVDESSGERPARSGCGQPPLQQPPLQQPVGQGDGGSLVDDLSGTRERRRAAKVIRGAETDRVLHNRSLTACRRALATRWRDTASPSPPD